MDVKLHVNATTTPKTRLYIKNSKKSVSELVKELGVSEDTVRKWKNRDKPTDRSHRRHNLGQSTNLEEEAIITALRINVCLSLDDITEVMKRCVNPKLTRSSIHRFMMRTGISKPAEKPKRETKKFEETTCGFIHIDLKHLTPLNKIRSYVFVAIDRATRFVHAEIIQCRDAATISACLERFLAAFPHTVHTILTDNGSEFTDRFAVDKIGKPEGKPSGNHPFDLVCQKFNIKHKLIKPFTPQTNGMVERFNRRISEAISSKDAIAMKSGRNKFFNHAERNDFIYKVVYDYNRTRLICLNYIAPLEALRNQPGYNTCAGMTPKGIITLVG